jgi:predicted amidohydrolase YtcJ
MIRIFSFLFILHGLIACQTPPSKIVPDLVLYNGQLFTADSLIPSATAIAVSGGRIIAVGDDATIRALATDKTIQTDLKRAFVMPGLIEGHGHFSSLGRSYQNLDLMSTNNWAEIVQLAAQKAAVTPADEWIEGRGWHQEKWNQPLNRSVNGYPYHDELSAATPNHPVVLQHASGHGLLANQKAMELAGISRETPDPIGGRIVRDSRGELTGVFEENAMELIERPLVAWKNQRPEAEKQAAFDKTIALVSEKCLSYGITSFQDAGSDFWELAQYRRLAEAGQLPVRLWAMVAQPKASDWEKLADYPKIGIGNGFFTCRAVKAYFDGALGSYGAWLLAPYSDKPDSYGQNTTPVDTIAALAGQCSALGLQFCVHAIGDRANREVLDVFQQYGGPSLRWRVEHAQHIDVADIPRFGQLGVIASVQALHCTSDAPFVIKRLGESRARTGAYPWRSLLDSGARLANGTDAPVEQVNPFPCLYAAVTRRPATQGPFYPEQRMIREEMLLSYTIWNAWAAFEEQEKGSLSVGKVADMVVLNTNLLTCGTDDILNVKALQTYVGGVLKYDATAKK